MEAWIKGVAKRRENKKEKRGKKEIWNDNDNGSNMFVQKLGKLELGGET